MKRKTNKRIKKQQENTGYANLKHKVAALWTRVSTERQENNNCSLETQKKVCYEYAEKHGIVIKREFGGTHESAKTQGEKFQEMIKSVANDPEINVILVYSFDRFSRSGPDGMVTMAFLRAKGIYVKSATQQTDSDSASGKFMENIIFLFNQFENQLRRDKCVEGMTQCVRKGQWYNKPPLGYDKRKVGKDHILTINETGRILRNAFIWKAEGVRDCDIIKRLKQMGLNLDKRRLSEIMRNPIYYGYISHAFLRGELVKGNHEPLVDEEIFIKANGLTKVGYEHAVETDDFPLKRHVRCTDCGSCLTGYKAKGKFKYYKCNTKGCKCNHKAETLHQKYVELLDSFNIPSELKPVIIDVFTSVYSDINQTRAENKSVLTKRKTELESSLKEVQIRYGMGKIPEEVYEATSDDINDKINDVAAGLQELEKDLSNLSVYIREAIAISCKLGGLWLGGDFKTRQKLQNLVFPEGVAYDKLHECYRTDNANEVFALFSRISADCGRCKTKRTDKNACRSCGGV